MVLVARVHPEAVVVHMLEVFAQCTPGASCIVGNLSCRFHSVNAVHIPQVAVDAVVVLTDSRLVVAHFFPGNATVGSAENAPCRFGGFHHSINHIRIYRGDCQADTAEIAAGKSVVNLIESLAGICGLVNGRFRTSVNQRPHMTAALIGGAIDDIRVPGIQFEIRDAGVFAYIQDFVPGGSAIGGLVQAAISAGTPEWSLTCNVNHVRISGIDTDAPDMFRFAEAHILERAPAINRFVNAIAVSDSPL